MPSALVSVNDSLLLLFLPTQHLRRCVIRACCTSVINSNNENWLNMIYIKSTRMNEDTEMSVKWKGREVSWCHRLKCFVFCVCQFWRWMQIMLYGFGFLTILLLPKNLRVLNERAEYAKNTWGTNIDGTVEILNVDKSKVLLKSKKCNPKAALSFLTWLPLKKRKTNLMQFQSTFP